MLGLDTISVIVGILVGITIILGFIYSILKHFGIFPKFKKRTITITNHVHGDNLVGFEILNNNGESLHISNIFIKGYTVDMRYPFEILAYKKGESINWGIYRGLGNQIEEGHIKENDELIIEEVQGKKFVKKISELLELRNGNIKALIIEEK